MSQLDPNILKRNLPEDIYPAIEQANSNVEAAVNEIITRFKQNADKVASDFEAGRFDVNLQAKLDSITSELNRDFDAITQANKSVIELARKAAEAARSDSAANLNSVLDKLDSQTKDLDNKLTAVRNKVNTLAQRTGGLVAKTAIRMFTGGVPV